MFGNDLGITSNVAMRWFGRFKIRALGHAKTIYKSLDSATTDKISKGETLIILDRHAKQGLPSLVPWRAIQNLCLVNAQ